ncbi:RNA polymerase sigma factor [Asticcacaulis sp. AC402]|uniref:RNA polymerase sigma factor n=1 Tax=Asticcacaulis sp. AC402 TaxID=1282361 RepID=UPI0003C3FE7B|nr:RNA polymerase sigma factor [Asticcacaulis sp. AC402]ESQ73664.1 RNA polymerase sigma24 factor [Asticcacaulis sp. AC402]
MPVNLRISLPPIDRREAGRPVSVLGGETTRVNSDPDETLLERIGRGDTAAVSVLVTRKLPRLLSLARRMLGDPVEAEDVAQETLVRTWKQARDWVPGRARIDTWMHRVALNLCYDRLRRRRDQVSTDDVEIVDSAPGAVAVIEQAQNAAALQTALKALPERQRVAITLCYYQELSNIEAAALMEVSVEALESLLSRARRTLRSRLNPVEEKSGSVAGSDVYPKPVPKPGPKFLDARQEGE